MKKIFCLILSAMFFAASIAHAEIKNYVGSGEYIMSEFETLDVAKQRAKQKAERNACEQAGVFVTSYTKIKNAQVQEDEIIAITNGILNVTDVQYKISPLEDGKSVLIRATVKANINSDDVNKWLEKGIEQRSELARQNDELRKAIAEQDRKIAELQKQVANVKTLQDREKITQEFSAEDKIFLSNQKVEEATKFLFESDYNSTINLCTQAIELNSNNYRAYHYRAVAYLDLENYKSAIYDFDKSIQLIPNASSYYLRGVAYASLDNYQKAVEDYSRAIQISPNFKPAYIDRGRAYYHLKNYEQALSDCNIAIQMRSNDSGSMLADSYAMRGMVHRKLKNYTQAISDFNEAISLSTFFPYNVQYCDELSEIYEEMKNYRGAISAYTKSINIIQSDEFLKKYNYDEYVKYLSKAYWERGYDYHRLEEYDNAISDYTQAILLSPADYYFYFSRAYSYVCKNDFRIAIIDYDKVIQLNSSVALAYQGRGVCYQMLGNYTQAEKDFAKAKELGYNP